MKRIIVFLSSILIFSNVLPAQESVRFDDYFINKTMRIDYFHLGDAQQEWVTVDQVYQQGIWAGSRRNLIDNFNNGRYAIKIYDSSSEKLIFSKGFDSYFGEYKTTTQALEGKKRTYHESALIPFPKQKITFTVESRNRENKLKPLFSQVIDPSSVSIIKENLKSGVQVFELVKNGNPHLKVDVALVAEGYTAGEMEKLKLDLKRFTTVFFDFEPYKTYKDRFNIYGVFQASPDSGCDEPRRGIFKNTALNSTFNSLGSERYLLTEDNKSLRDIAAHVPYDALFIMVNQKRYGGGGIYNLYCTFTVDNQWWEYLFLHEFGHHFAGLADEYYTSSVAYNEFYPRGVEPVEANITALLDPSRIKWKNLLTPGIEVPTPWEKEEFDRMDEAYQKIRGEINDRIAKMKREGAPAAEVQKVEDESERLSREHAEKVDDYLAKSRFTGQVGAFEGAGYSAQGLYRPMLDCLMFTKGKKPFCKVCERAVIQVIKYYSE
ncbi:MAG: IgA Peptidase M64 [Candidatus Aminicenantes bacterium]|nr:IgA Peptidase M64 [Candidatus Aminicenantes bacterium]MDH5706844.1 IgA Peptidase M64 [Candidatus Aminicenantes bacterium]